MRNHQLKISRPKSKSLIGNFFQDNQIYPKLTINPPNDKYEQEADAMADRVMTMPENNVLQRACENCGEEESMQMKLDLQRQEEQEEEEAIQTMPNLQRKEEEEEEPIQAKPEIQRQEEEEEPIQTKSNNGVIQATSTLRSQLHSSKGGGSPLPKHTNQFMSNAFGTDFSHVRVHIGQQANEMNQSIQAKAFTHGSDIYFKNGQYNPNNSDGKKLLAHELTHVVQQGAGKKRHPSIQRMKLTPVGTSPKSVCGSYSHKWKFELNKPAPCEGFMVQKVNIHETKKDCTKEPVNYSEIKPKETFWESWHHKKGDKVDVDFHKYGYSDNFSENEKPDSTGTHADVGYIKFFCIKTTGNLNKKWTPNKYSGGLPATTKQPSWWKNKPIDTGYHFANSWWNCCGPKKKHWSKTDSYPK